MPKTDQDATQYLCVRVQLVEVKSRIPRSLILGLKDNEYAARTYLPNMRKDAYEIFEKFDQVAKKVIGDTVTINNQEVRK